METNDKLDLYKQYFETSSDYYLRQMELYATNGRCSFSVAAFFLGLLWMAYRKMYSTILIIIAIIFVQVMLFEFLLAYNIISEDAYNVMDKLITLVASGIIGAIANRLYIKQSIKTVERIVNSNASDEAINEAIKLKGGTNWIAPIILVCIIVGLLILGV